MSVYIARDISASNPPMPVWTPPTPIELYPTPNETAGPKAKPGYHFWVYVYLHGQAEEVSGDDYVVANQPLPPYAGEYHATMCGREVIIVLANRSCGIFGGRAAFADDAEALAHVRDVESWR